MQAIIGIVVKYALEWVTSLALAWIKKESKINKDKQAIEDQVDRVNKAIEEIKSGNTKDTKELIDASRELTRNF